MCASSLFLCAKFIIAAQEFLPIVVGDRDSNVPRAGLSRKSRQTSGQLSLVRTHNEINIFARQEGVLALFTRAIGCQRSREGVCGLFMNIPEIFSQHDGEEKITSVHVRDAKATFNGLHVFLIASLTELGISGFIFADRCAIHQRGSKPVMSFQAHSESYSKNAEEFRPSSPSCAFRQSRKVSFHGDFWWNV